MSSPDAPVAPVKPSIRAITNSSSAIRNAPVPFGFSVLFVAASPVMAQV